MSAAQTLSLNDPREQLARALGLLQGFQDRIDHWRKEVASLERELEGHERAIKTVETNSAAVWAVWAEQGRGTEKPPDPAQKAAEYRAYRDVCAGKLATARAELEACEQAAATDFPDASAQIERAVTDVLLAEAHRVGAAYKAAIVASMRAEACLTGLRACFGAKLQGDAVAVIQAELTGGRDGSVEAERKAIRQECAAIRTRWTEYGDKLRANPKHREEP